MIDKYSDYLNIVYFKSELRPDKSNISYNTNEAIRKCSGDIIKVMHQDDKFIDDNILSKIQSAMVDSPDKSWGAITFNHNYSMEGIIRRVIEPNVNGIIGNPSVSFF